MSYTPGIIGEGTVLVVDAVLGDDLTGSRSGPAFKTFAAALAIAQAGDSISFRPGTYNIAPCVIPDNVSIRGLQRKRVVLQAVNVVAATTLITMGENCDLEHLTINLTSAADVSLVGILFGGTTNLTSRLNDVRVTVDGSAVASTAATTVTGVKYAGTTSTGTSANSASFGSCSSNVWINGAGTARAVWVSTACSVLATNAAARATLTAGAGKAIGVETTIAGAIMDWLTGILQGTTADLSQTAGTITLGDVMLKTNNSNGLSFNSGFSLGFPMAYAGALSVGTFYFSPGAPAAAIERQMPVPKACIVTSIAVRINSAVGSASTYVVRKNGVDTALVLNLATGTASGISTNAGISFAAGDRISLRCTITLALLSDIAIMVGAY